jgi:hypothetical protein
MTEVHIHTIAAVLAEYGKCGSLAVLDNPKPPMENGRPRNERYLRYKLRHSRERLSATGCYSLPKLLDDLADDVSFVRMYYNEMVPLVRHSRQEPNDVAKMVLSYKNYRWLYEREWRMFAPLGKTHYTDKSCVTRVYLGSRVSSDKRTKIIKAMTKLGIETHDMKIEKYSMTFEPCS